MQITNYRVVTWESSCLSSQEIQTPDPSLAHKILYYYDDKIVLEFISSA